MKLTDWAFVLLLAPHILFVAGCTKSYQPDRDTLVVALSAQPLTLDPRFATDATGVRIANLIFSSLVRVDDSFHPVPEAAERWESKGPVLRFYLRRDLEFHNRRKLLPEDLIFTFDFYRGPQSPFASEMRMVKTVAVEENKAGLILVVELTKEYEPFLTAVLPSVKILPKREILAAGDDFNQSLIGTGPWRFARQTLNEIRLDSVRAKIDHLIFKVIRDDFTRYQKMLKGEVDIAQNELPSEKVEEFQRRPRDFQVFLYPGLNMSYLLLNLRDPLLRRREVRLALAQSINRKEIIEYKMRGLAKEATSILTPNNPYFNPQIHNPALDTAVAARLMEKSGAKGVQFVLKTANTPATVDSARVLAHQMQTAGIRVRHESYEWATFYDDVKKGNFQLATMKWVGTVDPDIYRAAFHSSETPPGRNRGGYQNPDVDRLLDQGQAEGKAAGRKKIFDEVQRLVHDDLPIIPLWYDTQVAVARSCVRGYHPAVSSDYWPFTSVTKDR